MSQFRAASGVSPALGIGPWFEALQHQRPLRKAVIPSPGLGTRFLPATKALPKDAAGRGPPGHPVRGRGGRRGRADDLLLITGRSKTSLEDHFDRRPYLEELLEAKGDYSRAALVQEPGDAGGTCSTCARASPSGWEHAVLRAAGHVGDNPSPCCWATTWWMSRIRCRGMAEVRAEYGGSVLLLMEVSDEQISAYGCAAVEPTEVADVWCA